MALIKCPECGHQVSDMAKTCPQCGVEIAGNIVRKPDGDEVILKSKLPKQTGKDCKKSGRKRVVIAVAFLLALCVFGGVFYFYQKTRMQNEQHAYENALLSNELAVMQSYLDLYTEAPAEHRDSVRMLLETMKRTDFEWHNAVASLSKSVLQQFVRTHPGDVHNTEALLLIDSIDWVTAKRHNKEEDYRHYMDEHSDGSYYDEARVALENLETLRREQEQARIDSLAVVEAQKE